MRVCLIGATHPCHNPRLVREADTLAEAGHEVRVVAPCHSDRLAAKDQRLMSRRKWRLQQVDFRPMGTLGRWRAFVIRGRRRAANACRTWFRGRLGGLRNLERSYTLALPELKRLAAFEPADWFIAHTQAALPVAAWAARRQNAKLGFDCEDLLWHSSSDPVEIIQAIEAAYLPQCEYVSVPSQAIGRKIEAAYGVTPLVLFNVFPCALAGTIQPPVARSRCPKVRLHWFSQTIGPGRGIEDAVAALQWLDESVELHLRGSLSDEYRVRLNDLASGFGVTSRLFCYPQVDHDDLIPAMADYDIGLALERPEDPNYSLTITNKVFSYLLAGLPVVATETPGHLEALAAIPNASASYPAGDARALAKRIERWSLNPQALREAQQCAWEYARETFCWEQESQRFLKIFENAGGPVDNLVAKEVAICAKL
jgi:glycosyltransferase involved in cell wall biosynthesis